MNRRRLDRRPRNIGEISTINQWYLNAAAQRQSPGSSKDISDDGGNLS
jgi:hypothetical protein